MKFAMHMKFDMIRNNETKNLAKWKGKKEEKLPWVKTLLYRSNGGITVHLEVEALQKCEGKWAYIFTLTPPLHSVHSLSVSPPVGDQKRCDGCDGGGGIGVGNGIRQVVEKYCIRPKFIALLFSTALVCKFW